MNKLSRIALAVAGLVFAGHAAAQVTFYEHDDFQGQSFTTNRPVNNFERFGFNDRASSVVVRGNRTERWEVCEDIRFTGRCVILRRGEYPSLAAMGLSDRVTSMRAVNRNARYDDDRYAPAPPPEQVSQVVFYEHEGFEGRSFTAETPVVDFRAAGFNDSASSVVVRGSRWEVCDAIRYAGRCVVLRPGQYASLSAMGLNDQVSSVRAVSNNVRVDDGRFAPAPPPVQVSQVVFYEHEGFEGRSFTAETPVVDFRAAGFNDSASSVVVRGSRWEVCDAIRYAGRCVVLRPGQYASLSAMGLNDRVSSVRAVSANARVDDGRFAPAPVAVYDYGRRNNERIYQASITSVRAVVDNSGQRCWVESEQVVQDRSRTNVPGALLGAVIGGVLGHQVGGGTGRDVATGIGVVAGAAIGGASGRSGGQLVTTQNVQRCTSAPNQMQPTYYDVTYNFRGVEHRVQMTTPPGATVSVNEQGEPRA